jgi:uncharacterized phage protein (TIGR02218 family)
VKTATGALVTFLNSSNTFNICDLYDIFLANGDNLRLANSDRPIVYPATGTVLPPGTFLPTVGFERAGVQWSSTLTVQSLDVTMLVNETILYNGKPLAQAALEGIFDGARIKLYRAFFDANSALVDALFHFEGTVANVEPTSSSIRLVVNSELDKLRLRLPLNIYQPGCSHAFLDQGCDPNPPGTLRAASTSTGALVGTPTAFVVSISGSFAANNWQLGVIKMTSGTQAGLRRAIRSDVNAAGAHALTLSVPFPAAPLAGDTYSLTLGCDRKFTTCTTKGNASRFRGFPHMPRPEDGIR